MAARFLTIWTKLRWRWLLVGLLLAATGAALVLLRWQGLIRPVRIAGGSMSDTLAGAHYQATCRDCSIRFRCGLEYPPFENLAVCPNCGYTDNPVAPTVARGDRVLIDRFVLPARWPQRWDVVAYRRPDDPEQLAVKRVVGLPGERLEIRDGDLFVDGRVLPKSLERLRRMSILVHDDSHRPRRTANLPGRWRESEPVGCWQVTEDGYRFEPPDPAPDGEWSSLCWLHYHHWACLPTPSPPRARTDESPVWDNYGYNQGLSRGRLQPVADLLFSCEADLAGAGIFAMSVSDGPRRFEIRLLPQSGRAWLIADGEVLARSAEHAGGLGGETTLEFGLCDGHVIFAVARHPWIYCRVGHREAAAEASFTPLAVAAKSLTARLRGLQIRRDVHYLDPFGGGEPWRMARALGPDEFFLLGDNPPVSEDSRLPGSPAVDRRSLLGAVSPCWWGRR